MSQSRRLMLALALSLGPALCLGQYTDGQSVEAREGDTWSPATVIKREGRRYQIRYQGSTDEEWVTADRLREPGATSAAVPPQSPAPAGASSSNTPFAVGQQIEAKRGPAWRPGKVQKLENGWVLVLYVQGNYMEWVEPWRIRQAGSKEDLIGNAPMNKEAKPGDPAPATPPGEASGTSVSGWREPVVGDRVLYLDGWKTLPAKVMSIRGEQVQIQMEEGRSTRTVDMKDVRVAGLKLDVKVGQRVQIREPGGWQSGTVMFRETDRVRVMIDGWAHEMHHKWRSLDELRPAGANDVPPIENASADQLRQLPGYKEANASSARPLNLIVARGSRYTPDAAAANGELSPVQLSPLAGANEPYSPKAVAVSRAGKFAVVSSHARGKDNAIIDRLDLTNGDHVNKSDIAVPADMVALDLSPDGTRVLMGVPGSGERLEVWSIDGAKPARQLLLFPYAGGNHFEKQVKFAALVSEDRLLSISGKNEMHLWDVATGRAIYTCVASGASRPAISAGGKYIAFSTGQEAVLIEAATGKAILDLPVQLARATAMSFSVDGSELLACDSVNIYAVTLATGELAHDFALPGKQSFRSISSPAPGFALLNESILVELKSKAPVWKYNLGQSVASTTPAGHLLFTYGGGRAPALVRAAVPHASAQKQLQNLPQREMLLQPGAKVSLVVNLSGADAEREKITTYLRTQLTTNGFVVADNQPLRLIATLERGQPVSQEYGSGPRFGPFARPAETVTIAPWISRLKLEHNGQPVWEVMASTGGPSPILMTRNGQSAQQAADDQNKPNIGIFTSTRIPAFMVMPTNPLHKFESDFTGRNFRDLPAAPEPQQKPGDPNAPVQQINNQMV